MSTVSVIIPAYNQGHYLGACIQSVLDQTYPDFEVIVVNDGSTDNTPDVAQSFSDPRVRYVYQENRGLSGARNTGIRNATGTYITYLDSDDLFMPKKLELLTGKLKSEPELGFAAGQAILIDEHGDELGQIFDTPPPKDPSDLLLANPLHVGSVLLYRDWQERVGFFDESLRSYEDWDMWLRLARAGCNLGWVEQPVSRYRFHSAQMTRDGTQMTTATFAVLEKIYTDPDIPQNWRQKKDLAYSNAYLRAAPQAYLSGLFDQAQSYMDEAARLNPELAANHADSLASRISGWVDYGKTEDPLHFMKDVYNHLPRSLSVLQARRKSELSRKAVEIAFRAYEKGNHHEIREAILFGLRYNPAILINRGIFSIFLTSLFQTKE